MLAAKLPHLMYGAGNFVVRYSGQCRCPFRYPGKVTSMTEQAVRALPQDEAELRRVQETAQEAWEAIGKLPAHEQQDAADAWAAENKHLFYWCCGSPVFGGREAEKYYEESDFYIRGELNGSQVWWSGL